MTKLATASVLIALAAVAAGCGNQRAQPPDTSRVGTGGKTTEWQSPDKALTVRYPATWALSPGTAPAVATIATGGALATVYAYPRTDLGTDPASVRAQRRRIISSLEDRAPGFKRYATSITTVDGSPAVQVLGRGAINGHVVRSRSVHVFKPDVEWVIDAYATPHNFDAANRVGFGPILDSLKLADRVKGSGGTGDNGGGNA